MNKALQACAIEGIRCGSFEKSVSDGVGVQTIGNALDLGGVRIEFGEYGDRAINNFGEGQVFSRGS